MFLLGAGSFGCFCWMLEALIFWSLDVLLGAKSFGCSCWVLEVLLLFCKCLLLPKSLHFLFYKCLIDLSSWALIVQMNFTL